MVRNAGEVGELCRDLPLVGAERSVDDRTLDGARDRNDRRCILRRRAGEFGFVHPKQLVLGEWPAVDGQIIDQGLACALTPHGAGDVADLERRVSRMGQEPIFILLTYCELAVQVETDLLFAPCRCNVDPLALVLIGQRRLDAVALVEVRPRLEDQHPFAVREHPQEGLRLHAKQEV